MSSNYTPPPMAEVTAYPDHTANRDGDDEVVVLGEDDKITPTREEIAEWAAQYVGPVSGRAFAEHIWVEWNDYEPEGDISTGAMLCSALDQWRGVDAPPASVPRGEVYLSEEEVLHNRRQLNRVREGEGARAVKISGPLGRTQWLRISPGLFDRLRTVLTSPH